jgi:hypothetical protein
MSWLRQHQPLHLTKEVFVMGQVITPDMRAKILARGGIRELAEQHIILPTGQVVEPANFVVEEQPVRFILRLANCTCLFRSHPDSTHVLIAGFIDVYADGRRVHRWTRPALCRTGTWHIEEVLPLHTVIRATNHHS